MGALNINDIIKLDKDEIKIEIDKASNDSLYSVLLKTIAFKSTPLIFRLSTRSKINIKANGKNINMYFICIPLFYFNLLLLNFLNSEGKSFSHSSLSFLDTQ